MSTSLDLPAPSVRHRCRRDGHAHSPRSHPAPAEGNEVRTPGRSPPEAPAEDDNHDDRGPTRPERPATSSDQSSPGAADSSGHRRILGARLTTVLPAQTAGARGVAAASQEAATPRSVRRVVVAEPMPCHPGVPTTTPPAHPPPAADDRRGRNVRAGRVRSEAGWLRLRLLDPAAGSTTTRCWRWAEAGPPRVPGRVKRRCLRAGRQDSRD